MWVQAVKAAVSLLFSKITNPRGSTQACSVNSKWGMFSELEYHVPAIGGETGMKIVEDRSQLWAFRGAAEDIAKIARTLLSNGFE